MYNIVRMIDVSVLWRGNRGAVGCGLGLREILRVKPEGFLDGIGLTQVTVQTFAIAIPIWSLLGVQYWKSWFAGLFWWLYFPVYSRLFWGCTGGFTPDYWECIFQYAPGLLYIDGELSFNILILSIWEWNVLTNYTFIRRNESQWCSNCLLYFGSDVK